MVVSYNFQDPVWHPGPSSGVAFLPGPELMIPTVLERQPPDQPPERAASLSLREFGTRPSGIQRPKNPTDPSRLTYLGLPYRSLICEIGA